MYKNILSIGTALSREQQLEITGGVAPDCEPPDKIDIIICIAGEDCP